MPSVEFGFIEGIGDDIMSVVNKLQPYLNIVKNVAEDPALPDVMKRIQTMRDTASKQAALAQKKVVEVAKAAGKAPPPAPTVGIGLKKFVAPLNAVVWVQAHPVATVAIAVGGLVAIGGLGFLIGRKTAKKSAGLGGLDDHDEDVRRYKRDYLQKQLRDWRDGSGRTVHEALLRDAGISRSAIERRKWRGWEGKDAIRQIGYELVQHVNNASDDQLAKYVI